MQVLIKSIMLVITPVKSICIPSFYLKYIKYNIKQIKNVKNSLIGYLDCINVKNLKNIQRLCIKNRHIGNT